MRKVKNIGIALLVVLFALAGCSKKKQVSSSDTGAAAAESGDQGQSTKSPAVKTLPRHPLTLKLLVAETTEGNLELVAQVMINGRLPADPVLKVHLPAGSALEQGRAEETLSLSGGSEMIERRFIVTNASSPVRVTVDAAGPSSGAHAEAKYPETADGETVKMPETIPISPVKIHGVTIEKAIPVQPKKPQETDE